MSKCLAVRFKNTLKILSSAYEDLRSPKGDTYEVFTLWKFLFVFNRLIKQSLLSNYKRNPLIRSNFVMGFSLPTSILFEMETGNLGVENLVLILYVLTMYLILNQTYERLFLFVVILMEG